MNGKKLSAAVTVKVEDRDLITMLVAVVEANTVAMAKAGESFEKVSVEVRGLRATIQGAQRKIGGEIGPAIDRVKETQRKLDEEREEVRRAGSSST